jgi:hypothetical protein
MDTLQLLEDAGTVVPADDNMIEGAVDLVLAAAFGEASTANGTDPPHARRVLRRHRVVTGAGALAIAAAAALVVATLLPAGDTHRPSSHLLKTGTTVKPALLTVASIRRIAATSTEALAQSGTAVVTSNSSFGSAAQPTQTTAVTFSGQDVNFAISTGSSPSDTAINRIVDGQLYLYIIGQDLQKHWYHDTAPNAASSLHFPDPRTLVQDLTPGAGFVNLGQEDVNGVELTRLTFMPPMSASSGMSGSAAMSMGR